MAQADTFTVYDWLAGNIIPHVAIGLYTTQLADNVPPNLSSLKESQFPGYARQLLQFDQSPVSDPSRGVASASSAIHIFERQSDNGDPEVCAGAFLIATFPDGSSVIADAKNFPSPQGFSKAGDRFGVRYITQTLRTIL